MKDSTFYLRLGSIWNSLNSFLQELSIPTHTQKAITDIAENLMRVEINNFFNDWLVVAYIPDEKNVEEPQSRKPSGIIEKKIYDYLHECLYILVHWWEHKIISIPFRPGVTSEHSPSIHWWEHKIIPLPFRPGGTSEHSPPIHWWEYGMTPPGSQ